MPSELIGKWITSAPEYADRYMKIEGQFLIYGTGDGQEDTNYIIEIENSVQPAETVYVITYNDIHKKQWKLRLSYYTSSGQIRLWSGDEIWTKTTPESIL